MTTEEYEFDTIDEAFQKLRDYSTNGPEYSIVQGNLYDNLRKSSYVSPVEATDVSRMLNNGEIEEARQKVDGLLEPEED